MRIRSFALFASLSPFAALSAQKAQSHSADVSIALRVSTLGFGGEVSKLMMPHAGLRVGANFYSMNRNFNQSDITFDAKLKLQAIEGLVDLYPGARGLFHLTGGVITNPASVTGTGVPSGSTFDINDQTYPSSQVGTLNATTEWPSVLPYVGLGFGTPAASKKAVRLLLDIGAAIGKAKVGLKSSTGANNATLQADLNAQVKKAQDNVNKIPVYPVVSFGLAFRF